MEHFRLYIDGEFVDAADGATFETFDPGSGMVVATVAKAGPAEANAAVEAARRAFDQGGWSDLAPADRARRMMNFADHLGRKTMRLALMEAMDSGGIINRTKSEPFAHANMMRNLAHYAAHKFPWRKAIQVTGNPLSPGRNYVRHEPLGVSVGIVPWNFPMMMAMWKIAPAMIMGNTVVLKPATLTPLSALIIAEAAHEAGLPKGVLNVLAGPGADIGKTLCTHPLVDKIAFTGSTEVGRSIMQMGAGTIKKVTLELGGKSANIVLDDADLDLAVDGGIFGTFFHSGQICESGTRILVHAAIHDAFVERLVERVGDIKIGYQLELDTRMGPLISAAQLETTEYYVQLGQDSGAELVCGGSRAEVPGYEKGFYYRPTAFIGVDNASRLAQEEIFGPVVCIQKFDGDDMAVSLANDSIYGLAGGIWSRNIGRAERMAERIRTGTMWINDYHAFGNLVPFGGYKQSGVGREMGEIGLAEYTEVKRVHVSSGGDRNSRRAFEMMLPLSKTDSFSFHGPTKINAGPSAIAGISHEVAMLDGLRVLLLTDPGVRDAGLADIVARSLGDALAGRFDDVPADTSLDTVDQAAHRARELGADMIVSVGGGSVIDTGKVLAVVLKEGGRAMDHIGINRLTRPQTPHIVVPTTCGTGSEVTSVAVVKNPEAGRKVYLLDPYLYPNGAILDPQFVACLPAPMVSATAMDALTHAIEAAMSRLSNEVCTGHALQAIRLIASHLPEAVAHPQNIEARGKLQIAATMAGWAFTVAQVGLAHAVAHSLGALLDVPHGLACGIMLPHVMRFNADYVMEPLSLVANAMGVAASNLPGPEAGLSAADRVRDLMVAIGHPSTLSEVGVSEDRFMEIAMHALADPTVMFAPRPPGGPNGILEILQAAK